MNPNFAPNCGRNLQGFEGYIPAERNIPPLNEPYYYERNGKRIDLNKVICTYGLGWRKIGAYGYLMTELCISKREAKEILAPLYIAHAGEKISYGQSLKANLSLIADEQEEEQEAMLRSRQAKKRRIQELEQSGVVYCPKCLSTSVQGAKRGYSAGWGWIDPRLGAVGANEIRCVCLKCGHKWEP